MRKSFHEHCAVQTEPIGVSADRFELLQDEIKQLEANSYLSEEAQSLPYREPDNVPIEWLQHWQDLAHFVQDRREKYAQHYDAIFSSTDNCVWFKELLAKPARKEKAAAFWSKAYEAKLRVEHSLRFSEDMLVEMRLKQQKWQVLVYWSDVPKQNSVSSLKQLTYLKGERAHSFLKPTAQFGQDSTPASPKGRWEQRGTNPTPVFCVFP